MANSKIYLGSTNIGSLFQGADDISIYLGDEKVYPLEIPVKWLATYQDSHTESAQCGSSSEIVINEINKTNLVNVEIGDCVTTIGELAFDGYSSLTSITIPNSVTSIDRGGLSFTGLIDVVLPNSLTSIGDEVFYECSSLTSIDIPNSVTSIGVQAFYDCTSLTSIDIPNSVTSIGNSAFEYCTGLTSITIPNSVTSIGNQAFNGCTSLTSINIPSGVTSINDYIFNGCTSLTSIVIPNSVTSIGDTAFYNCSGLTSITIEATTPPTLGVAAFDNTNNAPIYVPADSVSSFKSSWIDYTSRIQAIINS